MFEGFSIPARRVVFWARLEAGRSGSEMIEPEHLLLGLLAEDQGDWVRMMASRLGDRAVPPAQEAASSHEPFFSGERVEKLRRMLAESNTPGTPKPDAMDMPLAERSTRALIAAQERAGASMVGLVHVLWGLISDQENSISNLLESNGVTVEQVEDAIRSR
jgi:ATP-dependent Clp protease ATP-binding subunit ClpA